MSDGASTALRIGIAGSGAIALAHAAWLRSTGHAVALWSPGGSGAGALRTAPLQATGAVEASVGVDVVDTATQLCARADVLMVAVPVNGHKAVMDALLPCLHDGQVVLVSSMGSLSSLYLFEGLQGLGRSVTVASFGTTVFTARRESPTQVHVMTRRAALGVSALPSSQTENVIALCSRLFGPVFSPHQHTLATALTNTNPTAHVPLALFNWTRIERAEPWPQYHYMTPRVSAVIGQLDAERQALAQAFGVQVRSMEQHFAQSFGTTSERLADIAAELHAKRGGPPGPVDVHTRYLDEDVPFCLVFFAALGRVAHVPMPATQVMIDAASLIAGRDFTQGNDLLAPLALAQETVDGLIRRVSQEAG